MRAPALPPGRLGALLRRREALLAQIRSRGGKVSGIGADLPTFDARTPPDLARDWLALAEEIAAEERPDAAPAPTESGCA